MTSTTINHENEVHILFQTKEQLQSFVSWFRNSGFGNLVSSKSNNSDIESIPRDEPHEWGHFFEIE